MPNFWFGFNQTSESLDNFNVTKLPNPDQSNRSAVQWVRPVMTYLLKQTRPLKDKAPEKIILVFHWFISRFLCGFFLVFVDRFEISFSELLRKSAPTKIFVFRIALYHVTGGVLPVWPDASLFFNIWPPFDCNNKNLRYSINIWHNRFTILPNDNENLKIGQRLFQKAKVGKFRQIMSHLGNLKVSN